MFVFSIATSPFESNFSPINVVTKLKLLDGESGDQMTHILFGLIIVKTFIRNSSHLTLSNNCYCVSTPNPV